MRLCRSGRRFGALLCAVVAVVAAGGAIAATRPPPWQSGRAASSPLETRLTTVAREWIGGGSIVCNSPSEWAALGAAVGFDPATTLGYAEWANGRPQAAAEISPRACSVVDKFFAARNKSLVSIACRTGKRVRECGDYMTLVASLQKISREIAHLRPARGYNEPEIIECYGMQVSAFVALRLGSTHPIARRIASDYWKRIYNTRVRGTSAWSPDCVDGGDLDLFPANPIWPAGQ